MHAVSGLSAAHADSASVLQHQKLVTAAHEFEAQMMKELLKPMTGTDALTGEEGDADSDTGAAGPLGEFASEALGNGLSKMGGFGIADGIVGALSHSGNSHKTGKVTGNLHPNTVIKTLK